MSLLAVGTRVRVNDQYTKQVGDLSTLLLKNLFGDRIPTGPNPRIGMTGTVIANDYGALFPYHVKLDQEDGPYGIFAEGEIDVIDAAVDA